MTVPVEALVVAGVVLLLGGAAAAAWALEKKRREAHEQHCLMRGFGFERERPGAEAQLAPLFPLFREGRSRKWGYTITGQLNRCPFTAFEYRWVTGGGKSSQTHRVHAMLWESRDRPLPQFGLTPEGWLTRLGALFGMQDIDFEDAPEFSRAYRLRGTDEAAIRRCFGPEVRAFFGAMPKQHVAAGGSYLLWWRSGRLPVAERLDAFLDEGDRVRRVFFES